MHLALFRGISLLSVFSKWYMACLMVLYEEAKRPEEYGYVATLGFRPGHGCNEIVGSIALVHRAMWEWRGKKRIWTFSGDIKSAFDEMVFEVSKEGMVRAGAHPMLIAATLEESRNLTLCIDFQNCFAKVPFNKCLKQGGKESPPVFRDGLIAVVLPVLRQWRRLKVGVVEGFLLNHLIWADNIFLLPSRESSSDL